MVRYVMLVTYTEVGASQIQNTTRRAQMFQTVAEQLGVRVESLVWTLGEYDAIAHITADTEDTAIALSAYLARQGYVRARLLRALTEEEFARVLAKMPGAPIELDG
ncbi:MAG TPA: GYD domain-containing protein [Fimbriiglobus sp.]|nr:GYD domain-containing protein [Fimbriiglobus sp.]